MLLNLKRFVETTVIPIKSFYRAARYVDYKILHQYILNINQNQGLESMLFEISRCLKEILDYELFGFSIKDGESLNIWVDPRAYKGPLLDIIKKDLCCQSIGYEVHYFDDRISEKDHSIVNFSADDLVSYVVSDKKYISRLYMLSKGKTFPYHRDIIDIIIRTMGIALDNSMNIKKLESEAHIDPLTSCYNRRALDNYVEHDIANAKRYDGDLSIIMFDIDHFKVINDTYGHGAGDKVLKEISGMIRSTIRGGDYIARYGGEEFVLALPETKLSNAVELAEKLRRKIENYKINLANNNKTVSITASFGVSALRNGSDKRRLFREADEMLYRAKLAGRNKVLPGLRAGSANISAADKSRVFTPGVISGFLPAARYNR